MKFFGRRKSGASALKDRARSAASLQRRVYPQNRLDRKIAFYCEFGRAGAGNEVAMGMMSTGFSLAN